MSRAKEPEIVPLEYAGKWLAWSQDASRIVAAGDTLDEARVAAERAGCMELVYEWVPPADERFISYSLATGIG